MDSRVLAKEAEFSDLRLYREVMFDEKDSDI